MVRISNPMTKDFDIMGLTGQDIIIEDLEK